MRKKRKLEKKKGKRKAIKNNLILFSKNCWYSFELNRINTVIVTVLDLVI